MEYMGMAGVAAVSVIAFAMTLLFSIVLFAMEKRKVVYEQ